MKIAFLSSGNVYFNEFSILANGNGFYFSWKQYSFIQSFDEVFEIWWWWIFQRKPYYCLLKLIFWLLEDNFINFLDTPATESYFSSSRNEFLNKFFIPYGADHFILLIFFFYMWKTVTEISGNPFFIEKKTYSR